MSLREPAAGPHDRAAPCGCGSRTAWRDCHGEPIILEVGFDFGWDERRVWALDVPVEDMPLADLSWHFDVPFLWEREHYDLRPREVLTNPAAHPAEWERTQRADLSHPIDVMRHNGRWVILDGLHRLMRASSEGQTVVRVRRIPRSAIPSIRADAPS